MLSFLRWIVGAAIAFGTITLVAYEQHSDTEKYKRHREEYCAAFTTSTEQKEACTEEGASARDYLPWGYNLVSWPEGITTWAIIFIGFAIVWQSWEARKSAETARQMIVLQHRPKVCVRSIRVHQKNSADLELWLTIGNSGGTVAHIQNGLFQVEWIKDGRPEPRPDDKIEAFDLRPGESKTMRFLANKFAGVFGAEEIMHKANSKIRRDAVLRCCHSKLRWESFQR